MTSSPSRCRKDWTRAPHGVMPRAFPVFSKPIMNLRGMGTGSQVIASAEEYKAKLTAGHFWCTLLTGAHVSTDAALVDGEPRWWRHTSGATAPGGTFDHWHIHAEAMPEIEDLVRRLGAQAPARLHRHGEFRNDRRADHRGASALRRSVARSLRARLGGGGDRAVCRRRWTYPDTGRADGFSVVLFGRTARGIAIRRARRSRPCGRWMAYRACKSRSTKTRTRRTTRCLPAASGWRSSTRRPLPPGAPDGKRCGRPFCGLPDCPGETFPATAVGFP